MKKTGHYNTAGLIEAQFEPGSRGRVLKNLLGIKRKREMDRLEKQEQLRAFEGLIEVYDKNHRFTATDICNIHKVWLGKIYEWAGNYRHVNLSKGDFAFAAAGQIPKLMADFELVVCVGNAANWFVGGIMGVGVVVVGGLFWNWNKRRGKKNV